MSPDEGQEELEEVQAEIKKKDEEVSHKVPKVMTHEILRAVRLHNSGRVDIWIVQLNICVIRV